MRGANLDNHKVIGSIAGFSTLAQGREKLIQRMAHKDTKILSMTITEGGYNIDDASGEFKLNDPEIEKELQNYKEGESVFAIFANMVRERKAAGGGPFTVMSCDNVQENGHVAKRAFLTYLEQCDKELLAWAKDNIVFVNSMVDRITPVPNLALLQPEIA